MMGVSLIGITILAVVLVGFVLLIVAAISGFKKKK